MYMKNPEYLNRYFREFHWSAPSIFSEIVKNANKFTSHFRNINLLISDLILQSIQTREADIVQKSFLFIV